MTRGLPSRESDIHRVVGSPGRLTASSTRDAGSSRPTIASWSPTNALTYQRVLILEPACILHGSSYCALESHTQGVVRTIELYADVTCPFTHAGLRRLVERRAQLDRHDVALRVRSWPLELVNGKPLKGDLVGEEIAELRTAATPDLFAGFNSIQFPHTSLPALMLEASAYLNDDRTGEEVSLALRTALFEQGRDVSDPAVLAAIAASVGIAIPGPEAAQLVHADWHEGERRDVSGSPFFFVGSQGFFCPTLKIEHTEGHLKISVDPKATEAFFDHCFS